MVARGLNNYKIKFKSDTGAEVNLILYEVFNKIKNKNDVIFNGNSIIEIHRGIEAKPLGLVKLNFYHKNNMCS